MKNLFFGIFCGVIATCVTAAIPQSQYEALEALYYSTDGDNWVWQSDANKWNFTGNQHDPCSEKWEGIMCPESCLVADLPACFVTELKLEFHNMTGTLPAQIGNLTDLVQLDLSFNRIAGTVPSAIASLSALSMINFTSMCIEGEIPLELDRLSNLQQLILANNYLEGTIPNWISAFKNLSIFDIQKNDNSNVTNAVRTSDFLGYDYSNLSISTFLNSSCLLSARSHGFYGTIPDITFTIPSLTSFLINDNHINGTLPSSVATLQLQSLDVAGNMLTGTIPQQFSSLSKLSALSLGRNRLFGTLPPTLFIGMSSLQALDLNSNSLQGVLPSEICYLKNLKYLWLYSNNFTSTIPSAIGELTNLEILALGRGNCFRGEIPTTIGLLNSLLELEISDAIMTGSLPAELSSLHNLQILDLRSNRESLSEIEFQYLYDIDFSNLTSVDTGGRCSISRGILNRNSGFVGQIPNSIWNLSKLKYLNLGRNNLNGTLPNTNIQNMAHLSSLSIAENLFAGTIPTHIGHLTSLELLEAQENNFIGRIPSELCLLSKLIILRLQRNLLNGVPALPLQFTNLQNLRILRIDRNSLKGSLPSVLWSLSKLLEVRMHSNDFDGTISEDFFKITQLKIFSANNNRISGHLSNSTKWSSMKILSVFDVFTNFISGTLPASITTAPSLRLLSLADNLICGTLPTAFSQITQLEFLGLGGNLLSGKLPDDWNMPQLLGFNFGSNLFEGTIPTTMGKLQSLLLFSVQENSFVGAVPVSVLDIPTLRFIEIDDNFFTVFPDSSAKRIVTVDMYNNLFQGTFPQNFTRNNRALTYFGIASNFFSGPLPDFSGLSLLNVYLVEGNQFSGTIPDVLSGFEPKSLFYTDFSDNFLTGELPDCIWKLPVLSVFSVSHNNFAGSIPENVQLPNLQVFNLASNHFSGRFPNWIVGCFPLYLLQIQDNEFTGPLSAALNIKMPNLLTLDVSSNQFTGSLPLELFNSSRLTTFAASDNCFGGNLSPNICLATNLVTLVLDGLSSNKNCNYAWNDKIKYFPYIYFESNIPECLMNMSLLNQIYLAGNALTGTLPKIGTKANISVLSLSNNRLIGTIPQSFFSRILQTLDLSTNRLNGILNEGIINSNLNLDLKVNRLSGSIPVDFIEMGNIEILQGNLFSCKDRNDLPHKDNYYAQYSCGSTDLNYSLYAWLGCALTAILILLLLRWIVHNRKFYFRDTISLSASPKTKFTHPSTEKNSRPTLNRKTELNNRRTEMTAISILIISDKWETFEQLVRWYRAGVSLTATFPVEFLDTQYRISGTNPLLQDIAERNSGSDIIGIPRRSELSNGTVIIHPELMRKKNGNISEMTKFIGSLIFIRSIAIIFAVLICIYYLPLYSLLKEKGKYATHEYQYGWIVTAAFLSGKVPTIILVSSWTLTALLFIRVVDVGSRMVFGVADHAAVDNDRPRMFSVAAVAWTISGENIGLTRKSLIILIQSAASLVFNVVIVLAANVIFIIVLLSDVNVNYKIIAQWALSLFKVSWNSFGVPACFLAMKSLSYDLKILVFVATLYFNNVASLLLAAAFTDSSCFSDVFTADDSDVVEYDTVRCVDYFVPNNIRIDYSRVTSEASFLIPPVYNYSCGGSILRSFIPTIFYFYAVTAFALPVFFVLISSITPSKFPAFIVRFIPAILWPSEIIPGKEIKILHPHHVINSLIGHLTVLMTFGVMSPLLAAAIAITISVLSSMWIGIIGRYAETKYTLDERADMDAELTEKIDSIFTGCWTSMLHSKWCIAGGAGLFYMVMIFDIAGDNLGAIKASFYSLFILIVLLWAYLSGIIIQSRRFQENIVVRYSKFVPILIYFVRISENVIRSTLKYMLGQKLRCSDDVDPLDSNVRGGAVERISEMVSPLRKKESNNLSGPPIALSAYHNANLAADLTTKEFFRNSVVTIHNV